ncbi:acyl-coenzyme a oxidase [Stylonychia lemnae]|uniref:Acyl-coenzyme A oxidase n=1 Tax=Stylonychia lemnae TaxID=5949 RepID=A0A078A4B1_STYLE|nr:acyl-coenzyme a oxidase [Stylonychia lemnae]|eukprot:CDW77002.1 acyl-coenzyme a oxidase [Stylonychia lemnae]
MPSRIEDYQLNNHERSRPNAFIENSREDKRDLCNQQLIALHNEILKRRIFTVEQIAKDPETFLMTQQIKRDLDSAMLIKQSIFTFSCALNLKIQNLDVHFGLYMKSVINLGTEKHWPLVMRAASLEDMACFCMTELSHGSNVQGLKTRATYDPSTREFILNTPRDQDMKFWIGNLGKTAHIGVVFAQLHTQGKGQGVHAFVVPLRDRRTHQPLPGVLIGDCGAKIGHHGIDNGFLKFSDYRISKDALLDRFFQVADDGTYTSIIPTKGKRFAFVLSSLSFGRTMMAHATVNIGFYALNTAIRYGHLRRQFSNNMKIGADESVLINYQLFQYRLIPRLARCFVLRFGQDELVSMYFDNRDKLTDPKFNGLKLFHALITFAKSHLSTCVHRDLEEVRQALGGLGYSQYSEIGPSINDHDINLTWEGDNKVLLQQTAKFVLKNAYNVMQNKPVQDENLAYLKEYFEDMDEYKAKITEDFKSNDNIVRVFRGMTAQTTFKALMQMQQQSQQKGMYQAYQESLPFSQNVLSVLFGETFFIEAYLRRISNVKDKETRVIFDKLFHLYANYTIVDKSGDFRDQNFLSSEAINICKQNVIDLCSELKEELIPLTEIAEIDNTNIFSYPDAYERFITKVVQAPNSFSKLENRDIILKTRGI